MVLPTASKPVGFAAHRFGLLAHFDNAAGVVGNRAKGVHGQNIRRRAEHAHGGHRRPEQPGTGHAAVLPQVIRANNGDGNHQHRQGRAFKPHGKAGDDIGRRTRLRCRDNRAHGAISIFRVVLRDVHERHGRSETNQAAQPKMPPGLGA